MTINHFIYKMQSLSYVKMILVILGQVVSLFTKELQLIWQDSQQWHGKVK